MDKKRSLLNVIVSIAFKVLTFGAIFLVKRELIRSLGNDINGLNSLYTSLIGVLSIAELGIGTAITFCMYKPIVEGDKNKTAALFQLFRKIYFIIGVIVLVAGAAMLPFLPFLAKDYSSLNVNLYVTFALSVIAVVISYSYGAKTSLFNAYKDNYISTAIISGSYFGQYLLQILVLRYTGSFEWYLICHIIGVGVQWILSDIIVRKRHADILEIERQPIDKETRAEIVRNVKALFMHRIGGVLVNAADSVIISAMIGVGVLGIYSNYTMIVTSMVSVIVLFFTPLTSIIGHMFVSNIEQTKKYFDFFYTLNFVLGTVFFLGYYAVVDSMVALWLGEGLEVSRAIAMVITINYFIQFMRQAVLLFRDATGTFYNDRWKPVAEGVSNVILSVALVYVFTFLFGEEYAVVGVIIATIITNILICHIIEPYVLYRHAFNSSVRGYMLKNYICILIFVLSINILDKILVSMDSHWLELFVNGGISLVLSALIVGIIILVDKNFTEQLMGFISLIKNKFKRNSSV